MPKRKFQEDEEQLTPEAKRRKQQEEEAQKQEEARQKEIDQMSRYDIAVYYMLKYQAAHKGQWPVWTEVDETPGQTQPQANVTLQAQGAPAFFSKPGLYQLGDNKKDKVRVNENGSLSPEPFSPANFGRCLDFLSMQGYSVATITWKEMPSKGEMRDMLNEALKRGMDVDMGLDAKTGVEAEWTAFLDKHFPSKTGTERDELIKLRKDVFEAHKKARFEALTQVDADPNKLDTMKKFTNRIRANQNSEKEGEGLLAHQFPDKDYPTLDNKKQALENSLKKGASLDKKLDNLDKKFEILERRCDEISKAAESFAKSAESAADALTMSDGDFSDKYKFDRNEVSAKIATDFNLPASVAKRNTLESLIETEDHDIANQKAVCSKLITEFEGDIRGMAENTKEEKSLKRKMEEKLEKLKDKRDGIEASLTKVEELGAKALEHNDKIETHLGRRVGQQI